MQALVENKVWTEAELMALPDDGRKYELVEGEIVVSNAGIEHEFIGARLIIVLGGFVHGKKARRCLRLQCRLLDEVRQSSFA